MARLADRVAENVPGDFFVDSSCIDCDTCRELAPAVFGDGPGHAFVAAQPSGDQQRGRALRALVSCPTSAIGTSSKADVRAASRAFPEAIPGVEEVFTCGYASPDSYGASSYLIVRPEGNVLVDSPRAARPLLERIASLGGVRLMFLTHRDDVADHEVFRRRFGCDRILCADDVSAGTRDVEIQPRGRDPLRLGDDLLLIPVPGHTRGSAALLWRDVLFTGDHMWWSPELGRLDASREVCWWSWPEQLRSLARLHEHEFRAVLPGHGRRIVLESCAEMRAELATLSSLR
jgi:glyoxylase-like metal-dependent hydrolase (beta-lactamase superfamily II)/ferredoxin